MTLLGPVSAVRSAESLSREGTSAREGQGGDRRRRPQDDNAFAAVLAQLQRR